MGTEAKASPVGWCCQGCGAFWPGEHAPALFDRCDECGDDRWRAAERPGGRRHDARDNRETRPPRRTKAENAERLAGMADEAALLAELERLRAIVDLCVEEARLNERHASDPSHDGAGSWADWFAALQARNAAVRAEMERRAGA